MKINHLLTFVVAILLACSCKETNKNLTDNNNDKTEQKEEKSEKNTTHKSKAIDGSVASLLQEKSFFSDLKDAKSGIENGTKIEVKSYYEYTEKEGAEVLNGKAYVDIVAMGMGTRQCAIFKDGILHGVAYRTISTPTTYMLKMEFDNNKLLTASMYIHNETCLGYNPIKGKSITELENEFQKLAMSMEPDENKFKSVDCPKEIKELFQ